MDNSTYNVFMDDGSGPVTVTLGHFLGSNNDLNDPFPTDSHLTLEAGLDEGDTVAFTAFDAAISTSTAVVVDNFLSGAVMNHDVLDVSALGITSSDLTLTDVGADKVVDFTVDGVAVEIYVVGAAGTTDADFVLFNMTFA